MKLNNENIIFDKSEIVGDIVEFVSLIYFRLLVFFLFVRVFTLIFPFADELVNWWAVIVVLILITLIFFVGNNSERLKTNIESLKRRESGVTKLKQEVVERSKKNYRKVSVTILALVILAVFKLAFLDIVLVIMLAINAAIGLKGDYLLVAGLIGLVVAMIFSAFGAVEISNTFMVLSFYFFLNLVAIEIFSRSDAFLPKVK